MAHERGQKGAKKWGDWALALAVASLGAVGLAAAAVATGPGLVQVIALNLGALGVVSGLLAVTPPLRTVHPSPA